MLKKRLLKIAKWFAGIIVGLILLISGGLYFFKDEICGIFIDEINKHLKAKVAVSEVDIAFWGSFPNLSVDFNNVFIQDSYENATELDTLLYTDRIRLRVNPLDIWRENYTVKSIEISPGTLQLKVNEEGINNYDILKESTDSTESKGFDLNLEGIALQKFRISYVNEATDQSYRTAVDEMLLKGALSQSTFTTKAVSNLKILEARSGKVNLIKNQPARLNISVQVNQDSGTVHIPKSTIYVSNLPFEFNGDVDTVGYDFSLNAQNIGIEDVANNFSLDQTNDVKQFDGRGKLDFDLHVYGKNEAKSPTKIGCQFGINNGLLKDPSTGVRISKLNVDGAYSNEEGKDKEYLNLNAISFQTSGGPFKGNVKLTHFDAPRIQGHADGLLDLAVVHSLFNIPRIDKLKGTVDMSSDFKLSTIVSADGSSEYHIDRCEGDVQIHNVEGQMVDDQRYFREINGHVYLRNNQVGIDQMTVKLNKSDLKIDGVIKDVVEYFRGQGKLNVDLHLASNYVNVADLGTNSKSTLPSDQKVYMLPNELDGTLYLDIKKLDYQKHGFYDVHGNMTIHNRVIHFPRVSLQNGGADIRGSLTVEERSPEYFYLTTQLVSKNIKFKPLFKEWNNFDQDVITSKNISGIAQANVTFEAPFNLRGGVISSGIKATIGLQIDDGRLKNVLAMKQITESLRETPSARMIVGKENINRLEKSLLDLKFERLTNTLVIKNKILTIPTMSVESSALDIEASGNHTFDNQIDYRFGFRYRDLKAQKTSEFGEIIDDGSGIKIFMRMYGDMMDPTIEWDKQSRKEMTKAKIEEEKKTVKSIFKSEFGLYKNDTTIQEYIEVKRPHEKLEIEGFDPVEEIDDVHKEKKPKRDGKLFKAIDKMRQEKKKEEEESVSFEIGD